MERWLNRNWRVISGYAVLGLVLAGIEIWKADAHRVLWTGRYTFSAGDQHAIDNAERFHGAAINRAATRHDDPHDELELVSELRLVTHAQQEDSRR